MNYTNSDELPGRMFPKRMQKVEKEASKNENRTKIMLLAVILILLLIVIGLLIFLLLGKNKETAGGRAEDLVAEETAKPEMQYETSVIVDNPQALQEIYDGMVAAAQEGTMSLEMQTIASSSDGVNFSCYIGNAENNPYDMFIQIYWDETEELIYQSGLIPCGAHIESFDSSVTIPEGSHSATIVYNQVEDDHNTLHAKVNVGLELLVTNN